jgi:hypothetical protein
MNKGWFKIGNNASQKKWGTVTELQRDIDSYFEYCDNNIVGYDNNNNPIYEPYTIQGLAEALDCTRATLNNYEKKEGYEAYFYTIKRAKNKVEKQKVVRALIGKANPAITIFDLKNNHGHVDRQEVKQDQTSEIKIINSEVTLSGEDAESDILE